MKSDRTPAPAVNRQMTMGDSSDDADAGRSQKNSMMSLKKPM